MIDLTSYKGYLSPVILFSLVPRQHSILGWALGLHSGLNDFIRQKAAD